MSWDNPYGIFSVGVYNDSGDLGLRVMSEGMLGTLTGGGNNPVPPTPVSYGSAGGMHPLDYWQRRKLIEKQIEEWKWRRYRW